MVGTGGAALVVVHPFLPDGSANTSFVTTTYVGLAGYHPLKVIKVMAATSCSDIVAGYSIN